MIKLFNTLSKRVEVFKPIDDVVKIYCCGVTVYDLCHLGHARSYIAWDVLRRFLIYSDFKVKYVQNFTDIDDKILKRAKEESSSCLLYTSPSPRDGLLSRMPSSA